MRPCLLAFAAALACVASAEYRRQTSYAGQKLFECDRSAVLPWEDLDLWTDRGSVVTTVRSRSASEQQLLARSACKVVHEDVEALVVDWEAGHARAT